MEPRGQIIKAVAVIRRPRDGSLLVSEHVNPDGESFHRPLGGHVEYGEYALETVQREFREEIGQALTAARLAGVVENIFAWDGADRHEIVFVFTAAFADEDAYEIAEQAILDEDDPVRVVWRPQGAASPPLYPEGVASLVGLVAG